MTLLSPARRRVRLRAPAAALLIALIAALAWCAAPASADPPGLSLPCAPTSWSYGCGGVDADGNDAVSGQPSHGNFKDVDQQGSATIDVAFSTDGHSATYTSDKGLSDYTVAFCDGTVIDVESVAGDQKTVTFSYAKPIRSIRVKAGTSNLTFLSQRCGSVDPGASPTTLAITKRASARRLSPGQSTTFTIEVRNTGSVTADDVELCDTPDDRWTFVSATPFTPQLTGQASCYDLGSIAAGAAKELKVTLRLDADAAPGKASNQAQAWASNAPVVSAKAQVRVVCLLARAFVPDEVPVQKVEEFVGLAADETRTVQLSCPAGRLMTDAAPRIDAVDQGTGTLASVRVLAARSVSVGTYEFVLANTATGAAQVHLYGTCLPGQTANQGLALHLSDPVTTTQTWAPGRHAVTLSCASGGVPVAPGFALSGGAATLVSSEPEGAGGWTIGLDVSDTTTATLSIRCLAERVGGDGSAHKLVFNHELVGADVAAGQTVSEQVICGQQAKGVTASFDLSPGLLMLGHEPQPKTQVFRLWNPTGATLHATLDLVCVADRTVAAASCSPKKSGKHHRMRTRARRD